MLVDETVELNCNVDLGATQESIALLLVPPFSGNPRLNTSWGYEDRVNVYISGLLKYLMAVGGARLRSKEPGVIYISNVRGTTTVPV
jgi:hypothetical protein